MKKVIIVLLCFISAFPAFSQNPISIEKVISMIENNIKNTAEAMNKREYRLNDEGGYGGRDGWKTAKSWQLTKNVGKIEREAHRILEKYRVEKDYIHSGELHSTKELFVCSYSNCNRSGKKVN